MKEPISGARWLENRNRAIDQFRENRHFLFSAYPDADALGTMLALALYLRLQNKKSTLFFPSPLKANLQFMKDIIRYNQIDVVEEESQLAALRSEVDTVVFCDTAHARLVPMFPRLEDYFLSRGVPSIEIDHHFGNDSRPITREGIHLFRKANASTEIAAELLQGWHRSQPDLPAPFEQRNIVISLLIGMQTDTFGGRAVPLKEDYDHWNLLLGESLKNETAGEPGSVRENGEKNWFRRPQEILAHLNRLNPEQERMVADLKQKIVCHDGVAELNMLETELEKIYRGDIPGGNRDFYQVWHALAEIVPQEGGRIGLFYFNGVNAEGRDCIFLKIRWAFGFDRFDLRDTEPALKAAFGDHFLGGGGHAGAVSFRILPMEEQEFRSKVAGIVGILQAQVR